MKSRFVFEHSTIEHTQNKWRHLPDKKRRNTFRRLTGQHNISSLVVVTFDFRRQVTPCENWICQVHAKGPIAGMKQDMKHQRLILCIRRLGVLIAECTFQICGSPNYLVSPPKSSNSEVLCHCVIHNNVMNDFGRANPQRSKQRHEITMHKLVTRGLRRFVKWSRKLLSGRICNHLPG